MNKNLDKEIESALREALEKKQEEEVKVLDK